LCCLFPKLMRVKAGHNETAAYISQVNSGKAWSAQSSPKWNVRCRCPNKQCALVANSKLTYFLYPVDPCDIVYVAYIVCSVLFVRRCWAPVEWRHSKLFWWWWWWGLPWRRGLLHAVLPTSTRHPSPWSHSLSMPRCSRRLVGINQNMPHNTTSIPHHSTVYRPDASTRKVKQIWILMKQEMMRWQWHQLDHMQITCTSLQTDTSIWSLSSVFWMLGHI